MTNPTLQSSHPSFNGLAKGYDKFRPDYPGEILQAITQRVRHAKTSTPRAIDVGSGTGISTRALATALGKPWRVTGIEPSADMRETAARAQHTGAAIDYQAGDSSTLPAMSDEIDLILVAQALHWFNRPAFCAETRRVLAPRGVLAILYNDRDTTTPLIQAFETLMEA